MMFVSPNDADFSLWNGPRSGAAGVREIFGIANAYDGKGDLAGYVASLPQSKNLFLDFDVNSSWEDLKVRARAKPLAELIQRLRLKKRPEEISLMRKAAQIAADSVADTVRFSRQKGIECESHLAANMEYQSKLRGAQRLSYVPVVAGGDRGLVIHYVHNNQRFDSAKDLMLMDAGCMYFGYCSDITRTWPLSGRFSAPQRQLYDAVLRVQQGCLAALQKIPSITFNQLNDLGTYLTAMELDRLKFKNVERIVNSVYPHSIGHHLGLDLHDCPTHRGSAPLEAGNVITIEPGLYIPYDDAYPKEFQGLAVRIEDDVLIKGNGEIDILTSSLPSDPDAVESLMQT